MFEKWSKLDYMVFNGWVEVKYVDSKIESVLNQIIQLISKRNLRKKYLQNLKNLLGKNI